MTQSTPVPSSKLRKVPCPQCGTLAPFDATMNPYRPFCSERCKMIDLGAWSSERYRLTQTDSQSEDPPMPPDHDSFDA